MKTDVQRYRLPGMLCGAAASLALLFISGGCGSSEPTQEDWEVAQAYAATSQLEYRLDSLRAENRRMKEQVNAMAAENRSLTAKNAELETKLAEAPASPAAVEPAGSIEATSEYSAALSAYRKRDFKRAIQGFESLLNASIDEETADNCHYWLGESYYGQRKYTEAIKHFNAVLGYNQSEKKADAQLMIGNSYAAMGEKDAARKAYNKVISSYPSRTEKAQQKLAKLK